MVLVALVVVVVVEAGLAVLVRSVRDVVVAGKTDVAGFVCILFDAIYEGRMDTGVTAVLEVALVLEVLPEDDTVVVPVGILASVVGIEKSKILGGVWEWGLEAVEVEKTYFLATIFDVFKAFFDRNTPTPQSTPRKNSVKQKTPINRQTHLGHLL